MTDQLDTSGWDTSFGVKYTEINNAITNSWDTINPAVKSIDNTVDISHLKAEVGPWQVALGSSNSIVFIDISFISGTVESTDGTVSPMDVTGTVAQIELKLDYQCSSSNENSHQLRAQYDESTTCVRNIQLMQENIVYGSMISVVVAQWLVDAIPKFNFSFHDIDFNPSLYESSNWNFLLPSSASYALFDSQTETSSVFGSLNTLDGRSAPDGNPHMIPSMTIPEGCRSGFLLSGPLFVKQNLINAAGMMFEQPSWIRESNDIDKEFRKWTSDNFLIGNDGMTVTNSQKMKFATVIEDDGKDGIEREMYVDPKKFRLSVRYNQISFEFMDLYYDYSDGITVKISYTQLLSVKLVDTTDSDEKTKKVFGLTCDSRSCNIAVIKSRNELIRSIVETICTVMAAATLGGIAGDIAGGVSDAAEGAINSIVETAGSATANFFIDSLANAAVDLVEDMVDMCFEEIVYGKKGSMKGLFARACAKLFGSILGNQIGGMIPSYPDYIVLAANGNYENFPPFEEYVSKLMRPHKWPCQTGYEVKSLNLHTALQIGGNVLY